MIDSQQVDGMPDEMEQQPYAAAMTMFTVNMEVSFRDVTKHIVDINRDFKESIIKKAHTVKLNDQDGLNKKVEELKSQEGKELQ